MSDRPVRLFEPHTITINPTNTCTAACRHCSMNSGPNRSTTMDWPLLEGVLDQIFVELPHIRVIVFSGGESTLLGETLHLALRKIRAHEGVISRLVTNAFWATDRATARRVLNELREAGLDELNISTDDYHLPFISLQRVRNAFDAAAEVGFMSVVLASCHGPEAAITPDRLEAAFGQTKFQRRFDADGVGNPIDHSEQTAFILSNTRVSSIGRGTEGVLEEETYQLGEELYERAYDAGGCVWAIRSASISPKGRFLACCGFETEHNEMLDYGSIPEHGLGPLLDRADGDLITNMIAIIGPPRLKQLLEQICPDEVDFPRADYGSYCEVCQDLTTLPANRAALKRYQGRFVRAIVEMREAFIRTYELDKGGRLPPVSQLLAEFNFAGDQPDHMPRSAEDHTVNPQPL